MRKIKTEEEKVANNIGKLVSDLRIDLDQVGRYFAWNVGGMGYNRLLMILESAEEEKNGRNYIR